VKYCEKTGKALEELSLEEIRGLCDLIGSDVKDVLNINKAIARRTSFAGTAPKETLRLIEKVQKKLKLKRKN